MPQAPHYLQAMMDAFPKSSSARATRQGVCRGLAAIAAAAGLALPVALASPDAFAACGPRLQSGPGQNPIALAQRCGTTYQDLRRANPLINMKHGLHGQVINVPQKPEPLIPPKIDNGLPPAGSTRLPHSHVPIRPSSMLREEVPASPATAGSYTVARGDTLSAIASRNGVSLANLMAANPGVAPRNLQVGERIAIPTIN